MTDGLTARQTQILKALIDEYIETAEPVGSENLEKKYNLGVSPATIRNEMVILTKTGFLRQPHTSAGRVPTPPAMKFYIDQLMEKRQMSLAEEVKAKEKVWDVRTDMNELMERVTHTLAEGTKNLAISATDEGKVWHAGYSYIFSNPEFSDLTTCADLFALLEEVERIREIFFVRSHPEGSIDVLFGEELGWSNLSSLGIVATHLRLRDREAALGVIGSFGLSYPTVIPFLKYLKNLIEEVAGA